MTETPWWHTQNPTGAESGASGSAGDGEASPVGTAAQEAIKLAAAAAEWASKTGLTDAIKGLADQSAMGVRMATKAAHAGTDIPEWRPGTNDADLGHEHDPAVCDYCPVCQGMNMLRSVSPEAANSAAEALSAVTLVIRQAIESLAPEHEAGAKVEHIDIDLD